MISASSAIVRSILHASLSFLVVALLSCCLVTATALAAGPDWRGVWGIGGSDDTDARAIKVLPNNDYYVTGEFDASTRFPGTTLTSLGGLDVFLAKYSASGQLLWVVQAGGPGGDV